MNYPFKIGDIVHVLRGQQTRFFEVIKVENASIWVSDGHIQTKKSHNDLDLICRAEDRKDETIPIVKYFK